MQQATEAHSEEGLVHALLLDGEGGAKVLGWAELVQWKPEDGLLWAHFDYSKPRSQEWIRAQSGLDDLISDALLTEETRPRSTAVGDGLLLAMRGVNLNPDSNPEDMVSIRLWIEKHRLISSRHRRLLSVSDLRDELLRGTGPSDAGDLVTELCNAMVWRMSGTVEQAEERVDELEEEVLTAESHLLRSELAATRRQTIMLRRYLAPQRDALARLAMEKVSWLTEEHRMRLREVNDRLIRHLEDLDAVRERAAVTQEELASRLAEQMNNRMYVLSVVAALFLPLGFLTGLLGINVGGIPGADEPSAFVMFVILLVLIVAAQFWIFKRLKWF